MKKNSDGSKTGSGVSGRGGAIPKAQPVTFCRRCNRLRKLKAGECKVCHGRHPGRKFREKRLAVAKAMAEEALREAQRSQAVKEFEASLRPALDAIAAMKDEAGRPVNERCGSCGAYDPREVVMDEVDIGVGMLQRRCPDSFHIPKEPSNV